MLCDQPQYVVLLGHLLLIKPCALLVRNSRGGRTLFGSSRSPSGFRRCGKTIARGARCSCGHFVELHANPVYTGPGDLGSVTLVNRMKASAGFHIQTLQTLVGGS